MWRKNGSWQKSELQYLHWRERRQEIMLLRQKISLLNKEDIHDIQPSVWCTLLELISFVAIVFDFRASSWLVQVCPNVFITNEPFVARYHNPENCCQNVAQRIRVAVFPSTSQVHLNYMKYCKKLQSNMILNMFQWTSLEQINKAAELRLL